MNIQLHKLLNLIIFTRTTEVYMFIMNKIIVVIVFFTNKRHMRIYISAFYIYLYMYVRKCISINNRVGEGLETAWAGQRVILLTVNGFYKIIMNFLIFF